MLIWTQIISNMKEEGLKRTEEAEKLNLYNKNVHIVKDLLSLIVNDLVRRTATLLCITCLTNICLKLK